MSMKDQNLSRLALPLVTLFILLLPFILSNGVPAYLEINAEESRQGLRGTASNVIRIGLYIGIWLTVAWSICSLMNTVIWPLLIERRVGQPIPGLLKDLFNLVIFLLAIGAIVALVFNQSLTGFLAASGVVGLIVGMAIKDPIADFFSGIILNLARPFSPGEWIQLEDGQWANVQDVTWRATICKDFFGNELQIPNSIMGSMKTLNYARPDEMIARMFDVILPFEFPAERALRILENATIAAQSESGVPDEYEPIISIAEVTDRGTSYSIYYYTRGVSGWYTTRTKVYAEILKDLRVAGVTPEIPKHETHYAKLPERQFDKWLPKEEILRRVALFTEFDDESIAFLTESILIRKHSDGESVVTQGETGETMFILVEGLLDVFSDQDSGDKLKVAQISPRAISSARCPCSRARTAPRPSSHAARVRLSR